MSGPLSAGSPDPVYARLLDAIPNGALIVDQAANIVLANVQAEVLFGYHPGELNDWFIAAFVDGTPWVMPANVVGMSQHADGGIVATKPYTSGGAYISTMSDFCGGCPFNPKKRLGEDACPFTAGYWAFLDRVEPRIRGNHRMSQPLAGLRRLADRDAVVAQERSRTVW